MKAASEGGNPTSLAGYGGTSLQSEVARAGNSCGNVVYDVRVNELIVPNSSIFEEFFPALPYQQGVKVNELIVPRSSVHGEVVSAFPSLQVVNVNEQFVPSSNVF